MPSVVCWDISQWCSSNPGRRSPGRMLTCLGHDTLWTWCASLASLFHSFLGRGLMVVGHKEEQDAQVAAKWWECYWMSKKSLFLNVRNWMLSASMKGLQVESSLNLIKHALFCLPKVPFYPSSWAQAEETAGAGNSLLLNTRTCDRASPCSAWHSLPCTCSF